MVALTENNTVYVSGHRGMLGAALLRELNRRGFKNIITADRADLDLTEQKAVFDFFARERPQAQIICAALAGGIVANAAYPGDFIGQNLMIAVNLLEAARRFDCKKSLFIGSSCIYPKMTPQPMKEEQLLTGILETTNEFYAVAKLSGIKMGQAYRRQYGLDITSVLPTNIYGPEDRYDLENSHVIPAMMLRFHQAKQRQAPQAVVWGSGRVRREFLHAEDVASAIVHLMRQAQTEEIYNIGCGEDITIAQMAQLIKDIVGYKGELQYDGSRPDGTPRKLLDCSRLFATGWRPAVDLRQGLADTYRWFAAHTESLRGIPLGR